MRFEEPNMPRFFLYLATDNTKILPLTMKPTFTKTNYIILLIGILSIALGYVLMIGGGSEDPNVFNPEIFNFQRITLAPMVCLIGFVTIIFAIMWRPKSTQQETSK